MATEKLTSVDGEVTKCDFEMVNDSTSKRTNRVSMSRAQAIAVVVVFSAIVILVGVLCYYETKRECDRKNAAAVLDNDVEENGDVNDSDNDGEQRPNTTPQIVLSHPPAVEDPGPWKGRLPADVIPESYDIFIKPYLNDEDVEGTHKRRFNFDGRVVIQIRCDIPTDEIVLHLSNITVVSINVIDADEGGDDLYDSTSYESRYSFLRIALTEGLQQGQTYNVTIVYIAEIREQWDGLYRSSYVDDRGNQSWMAVTQFQPVSARYAFPCFDEPIFKAIFNVQIMHRTNMVALSNGREIDTIDHGDGWSLTRFEPSPVMSIYLLAIAVGVLDYRETTTTNGIRLRTWSRPDAIDTTDFALESASSLITYFENYFGLPYQISKMDMIAIPDYGHGGMENWGLVTYPEDGLFFNPDVDTRSVQESMLSVIAHEVAHQWFGNLVTMEWWDDLWLNEGFGTYFGNLGADALHPEIKFLDTMVAVNNHLVLTSDALSTSHPIKVHVTSPSEIDELFDDISYIKGAAVIRMLHDMLGDDVFRSGIQRYLRTYEYKNANSDQLWDALTEADMGNGNIDVWQVMDTWILQMGYPLVNLTRIDERTVSAVQKRYLAKGQVSDPRESPYGYVWSIYLTHTDNGSRNFNDSPSVWIRDQEIHEFSLADGVSLDDWYLGNLHQFGFFRINYDLENWMKLIHQLKTDHEVIPVLNRAQLLEDSMNLAFHGYLPMSVALELVGYLQYEFSSAPWNAVLSYLIFFRDNLAATSLQGPYERYLRELTNRAYDELGLELDIETISLDKAKTREIIQPISCKVQNPDCSRHALELFQDFKASYNLTDPSSNVIDVNSLETLLCTAIREGTFEEWDYIWSLYIDTRSTMSQTKLWISALSCTIRPWQIQRLMEYPMQNPRTTHQVGFILEQVTITPTGRMLAWDYLRQNWDVLQNMYGGSYRWLTLIRTIASDFNTKAQLEELTAFVYSRDLGYGVTTLQQAITYTKLNIDLYDAIYPEVRAWLEAYDQRQ
nr:aminopeptidase N-like [Lytechinus pictus]